jgi:3-oxoacyl-[acyl-carrier-protein] synthase II
MKRKRVVVTGLSTLSPLGNNLETSWEGLLAGKSGIGPITLFDCTGFEARIAGEVKNFNPEEFGINIKQARRMDRFTHLAVAAGQMLLANSRYNVTPERAEEVGIILGVGLGGLSTIEVFHSKLINAGPNKVSPFMIPMLIANMAPAQVSITQGAKGPNLVMTSACASATHAIGYAYSEILLGRCEAVITGGVESTITAMGISGFTALKALSTTHNADPPRASRPFDKNRDGFVMGEGAGYLFIETLDSARARGADIYAEIIGFGSSGDAYHMTAPQEDGEGMAASMNRALKDAGVDAEEIDHINAHGTSTDLNDACETLALKKVFGKRAYDLTISANKSQIGHLLGAAGGVESVFACMTLHTGIVPGTINYETPDPDCDLNYMGNGSKKLDPTYALCSNYGFGGANASLLFKKFTG